MDESGTLLACPDAVNAKTWNEVGPLGRDVLSAFIWAFAKQT
jgi:hypothetical protein